MTSNITIFYVDSTSGVYLGGFSESIAPPPKSTAVPTAPDDARDTWDFKNSKWIPNPIGVAEREYANRMAAGIIITSLNTPQISGTYSIDQNSISLIGWEAQFISSFNEFTNMTTDAMPWNDIKGETRMFTSMSTFMAFAKVAGQYVSGCNIALQTIQGGGTATFPSNQYTIT